LPTKETYDELANMFYLPSKDINNKIVQLKSYEVPTYLEIVEELPRIKSSDKIDYLLLEKDALTKLPQSKKLNLIK